jgi:hypothetical protein
VIKVVCCCSVERLFLLAKWYVCRVGSEVKCSGEVIQLGFVGVLLTMGQRRIQSNKEKAGTEILAHFVNVHPLHVRRSYVEFRALLQRTMSFYCAGLLTPRTQPWSLRRSLVPCLLVLIAVRSVVYPSPWKDGPGFICSLLAASIHHSAQASWTLITGNLDKLKNTGCFVRDNGI